MRAGLLVLAALPLVAFAGEPSSSAPASPQSGACAEQYRESGVMKGEMKRVVAPDGSITYIFTEKSPCSKTPKAPSPPATTEDSSTERKPK